MITEWLVYGLAVSLLVSAAAWLAEQGAKAQRWPTRWIWPIAMAVSIGLPLAAWLAPAAQEAVPSVVAAPTAYVMQSIPLDVGPVPETGPTPTTVALFAWGSLSVLLLATMVVLGTRLYVRRRGWSRRTVDGVEVWVSRRTGPAALGMLRGHVVVPEWALELDAGRRRMLVHHEAEHVRARDPQVALAGLVACALVPWNLPLWWQLRRLRLAIEVDCDERVLRHAGDPLGYGSLLLEVSQRKSHLAVALAESRSMLERRIRMITQATKGPATLRAVGLAAVAGLVLAVACETPGPTGPADRGSNPLELEDVRIALGDESCTSTILVDGARSSRSEVDTLDPDEIESISVVRGAAARAAYGPETCGVISIRTESASPDEEAAARRLEEQMMAEQRTVPAQEIQLPPSPDEIEAGDAEPSRTPEDLSAAPSFTPMTVRPQLRNSEQVDQRLEEAYPPLLKEAGIGGTTNVWFLIDDEGVVQRTLVNQSSGYEALDQAALRVGSAMEFTPAYNRDRRVPVWVALDITFETQSGDEDAEAGP